MLVRDPGLPCMRASWIPTGFSGERPFQKRHGTIHHLGKPSRVVPRIVWCAVDCQEFGVGASFVIHALEQNRLSIWKVWIGVAMDSGGSERRSGSRTWRARRDASPRHTD